MPALETRGSLSRTVQVPVESASAYAASSNSGAHSATASLGALLSYTASATTGAVQYVSKSLMAAGGASSTPSRVFIFKNDVKRMCIYNYMHCISLLLVALSVRQARTLRPVAPLAP